MELGLTAEEAVTAKFGLAAAYVPGVVAEVQGPPRTGFVEGYDPLPAVRAVGDTPTHGRLRSELARVFEATGTRNLEELYAFLETET
jgi:hypothetical protein